MRRGVRCGERGAVWGEGCGVRGVRCEERGAV